VKNPGAFGGTAAVRSVAIHGRHRGRPSSNKAEASFGVSDPKEMNLPRDSFGSFPAVPMPSVARSLLETKKRGTGRARLRAF